MMYRLLKRQLVYYFPHLNEHGLKKNKNKRRAISLPGLLLQTVVSLFQSRQPFHHPTKLLITPTKPLQHVELTAALADPMLSILFVQGHILCRSLRNRRMGCPVL